MLHGQAIGIAKARAQQQLLEAIWLETCAHVVVSMSWGPFCGCPSNLAACYWGVVLGPLVFLVNSRIQHLLKNSFPQKKGAVNTGREVCQLPPTANSRDPSDHINIRILLRLVFVLGTKM